MTTPYTIECTVHFGRQGRGALCSTAQLPVPSVPLPSRLPRLARLKALALRLEKLLATGAVKDFRTLARLRHVSPARISQITSLLHLAPDIQEALLFRTRPRAWPGWPGPAAHVAACEGFGLAPAAPHVARVVWPRAERGRDRAQTRRCVGQPLW
jgi:hypothetical protein